MIDYQYFKIVSSLNLQKNCSEQAFTSTNEHDHLTHSKNSPVISTNNTLWSTKRTTSNLKKRSISYLIVLHLNQLVDVWNPLYAVAEDEYCKNMVRSRTNLVLDIQVDTVPRNNFIASVLQ